MQEIKNAVQFRENESWSLKLPLCNCLFCCLKQGRLHESVLGLSTQERTRSGVSIRVVLEVLAISGARLWMPNLSLPHATLSLPQLLSTSTRGHPRAIRVAKHRVTCDGEVSESGGKNQVYARSGLVSSCDSISQLLARLAVAVDASNRMSNWCRTCSCRAKTIRRV